jgi:hypothetical protein
MQICMILRKQICCKGRTAARFIAGASSRFAGSRRRAKPIVSVFQATGRENIRAMLTHYQGSITRFKMLCFWEHLHQEGLQMSMQESADDWADSSNLAWHQDNQPLTASYGHLTRKRLFWFGSDMTLPQ